MKQDFISINLKLVGSLCNLNCKYCYEHEQYGNKNIGVISVDDIINYINLLRNKYKYIKIILHGGEPLLYPKNEMNRLLQYYKNENNIHITIQTNGLLIDQEWIDIFKNYSNYFLFSISLDSKDSLLRDFKTDELFQKFKLIKNNNLKIGIVSVISKENIDTTEYKEFIHMLINKFQIDFLTINKIRFNNQIKDSFINELEYTNFLIDIFNYWIEEKLYNQLKINPFLDLMQNQNSCIFNSNLQKCSNFITIYPSFNIKGCDHQKGQTNNLSKCLNCQIFDFCGGGCIYEIQDETFCDARFKLFNYIQQLKNE